MASKPPLEKLNGRRLGASRLHLARVRPGEKSGWTRFELVVSEEEGEFAPPVIEGVYSAGGRGVLPWIEVLAYEPRLRRGEETLDLATGGLDRELFTALAELIPPGGHLMVGCETPPHHDTYQALMKGVPPAATPLGAVLFACGFRKVKFFYLAEGGWEGQQKLWAEKPLDEKMRREWEVATAGELTRFLAAPADAPAAQSRIPPAQQLLEELKGKQARKKSGG